MSQLYFFLETSRHCALPAKQACFIVEIIILLTLKVYFQDKEEEGGGTSTLRCHETLLVAQSSQTSYHHTRAYNYGEYLVSSRHASSTPPMDRAHSKLAENDAATPVTAVCI